MLEPCYVTYIYIKESKKNYVWTKLELINKNIYDISQIFKFTSKFITNIN